MGAWTEARSESDGTMPPDPKGKRASSLLYSDVSCNIRAKGKCASSLLYLG